METIAVDRRRLVEPGEVMVEGDFRCQASDCGRDLGHGDQRADFEYFVASEYQDGTEFAADLGEPYLAPFHSELQASVSVQNGSGSSGCRS